MHHFVLHACKRNILDCLLSLGVICIFRNSKLNALTNGPKVLVTVPCSVNFCYLIHNFKLELSRTCTWPQNFFLFYPCHGVKILSWMLMSVHGSGRKKPAMKHLKSAFAFKVFYEMLFYSSSYFCGVTFQLTFLYKNSFGLTFETFSILFYCDLTGGYMTPRFAKGCTYLYTLVRNIMQNYINF